MEWAKGTLNFRHIVIDMSLSYIVHEQCHCSFYFIFAWCFFNARAMALLFFCLVSLISLCFFNMALTSVDHEAGMTYVSTIFLGELRLACANKFIPQKGSKGMGVQVIHDGQAQHEREREKQLKQSSPNYQG
jgi:hypothetical protein